MKIWDFASHKRKTFPYFAPKELHFEFNRKSYPYFTFTGYLHERQGI
jgi:hypothetical protein